MVYVVLYDIHFHYHEFDTIEFYRIIAIPEEYATDDAIRDLVVAEYNGCQWARAPLVTAQIVTRQVIATKE